MSDDKNPAFIMTATCETGHSQQVTYIGIEREFVERQAGLLDGTSPMYVYPPGQDSMIGKCGICGKQIKCVVSESPV